MHWPRAQKRSTMASCYRCYSNDMCIQVFDTPRGTSCAFDDIAFALLDLKRSRCTLVPSKLLRADGHHVTLLHAAHTARGFVVIITLNNRPCLQQYFWALLLPAVAFPLTIPNIKHCRPAKNPISSKPIQNDQKLNMLNLDTGRMVLQEQTQIWNCQTVPPSKNKHEAG